jgi:hypothetical protein
LRLIAMVLAVLGCGHRGATLQTPIGGAATKAASSAAPGSSRGAVDTAPPPAESLSIRLQVRARRDHLTFDVPPDGTLYTGDFIELRVAVNTKAYVDVIQLSPDGRPTALLSSSGGVLLRPGGARRIPFEPTDWYQLDEDVGKETVYVIASREPIAAIDQTLGKEILEIREMNSSPPPSSRPEGSTTTPQTAPPGASRSRRARRVVRPERMLTIANRGIRKVSWVGTHSVIDTSAPMKGEGLVVAWFSFHHEHPDSAP